jgi:hypothetical protein
MEGSGGGGGGLGARGRMDEGEGVGGFGGIGEAGISGCERTLKIAQKGQRSPQAHLHGLPGRSSLGLGISIALVTHHAEECTC